MRGMISHVRAVQAGEAHAALPTGFPMLDRQLDGGGLSGLAVLAARPKKGKSIVAGDIIRNVARSGEGVLHISGEMMREELMRRHAGAMTNILTSRISKAKNLDEADMAALDEAAATVESWPYEIIDQSLTIPMIAAAAKRQNSLWDGNLKLVVIDYLHLMIPDVTVKGREQQIGLMMRQCKVAQQNMGIPWLVLSQFNRGASDGRPEPHQFRDSGQIEEHANSCIILDWADESTHGDSDWANGGPWRQLLLAVALQRSGVMEGWGDPVSRKLRYCVTRTEELCGTEM
jgi:replicative DNA helicase